MIGRFIHMPADPLRSLSFRKIGVRFDLSNLPAMSRPPLPVRTAVKKHSEGSAVLSNGIGTSGAGYPRPKSIWAHRLLSHRF